MASISELQSLPRGFARSGVATEQAKGVREASLVWDVVGLHIRYGPEARHTIKDRASLGVFVSRPFAAGHEIALANIVQGNLSALRYPWTGTVSSWLERERPDFRQKWTGHQEKKRGARRFKLNIGLTCVYRDGQFWNARPPCKDVEER